MDKIEPLERFFSKVEICVSGCWEWTGGCTNSRGGKKYGAFTPSTGHTTSAHRFSYTYFKGEIPQGMTVDHLCGNTKCVNPDHLEAVTLKENILRGNGWGAKNSRVTYCPNGHPYSEANTYRVKNGRACRICRLNYTAISNRKIKAKQELIKMGVK